MIKIVYSELIWELYSYYMDATNSDRENYLPYEELGERVNDVLNGGKKTFLVSIETAREMSRQAAHVGNPCSYDMLHPSTQRGFRNIAKKINAQL